MLLKYEHSLLDVFYFWACVVDAAEIITIRNVKTCLLLEVSVPVKKLRRLVFRDISLKKLPKFASEVCSPLLTANISENGVVHRICNVWQSVIL